jgi:hypothetical protein
VNRSEKLLSPLPRAGEGGVRVRRGRTVRRSIVLSCLVALCFGCGASVTPAFDNGFPDNDAARTAAIVSHLPPSRKLNAPANRLKKALVAAIAKTNLPQLLVYDIANGSVLWRLSFHAQSRPEIIDDLVLTTSRGMVEAFELVSGKPRWRVPIGDDLIYLGAARAGATIVYAAASAHYGPKQGNSVVTAIDAQSGRRVWERRSAGRLGAPAAVDLWVFVPWDWQNLAILDIADGAERARLRTTDDLIGWVNSDATGVSFGHDALYRLSARGYQGTRQSAPRIASPFTKAPVAPPLRESAYEPRPAVGSAKGRIQVFFQLDADDKSNISILNRRFYLGFYRYLFAFGDQGELVWCALLDRDLVNGQAVEGGLLTVEESGVLKLFDADTGRMRMQAAIPAALDSATFDASGIPMPPVSNERPMGSGATLRAGLTQVIADPDNRLVQARIFAVKQLAASSDPEATRDLLDLYDNDQQPEVMRQAIAEGLRSRKSGGKYLVDALALHYDFLRGTRVPPLSVIAPAAAAMNEPKALGPLVGHLFDPETPLRDLEPLVSAVAALGRSAAVAPLRDFFSLYRADSSLQSSPQPLVKAAEEIFRYGKREDRMFLASLASDRQTTAPVAATIDRLFLPEKKAAVAAAASQEKQPILPKRLNRAQIDAAFAAHIATVRPCVAAELGQNPNLNHIRLSFILKRDGTAYGVRSLPDNTALTGCLSSNIESWSFPRFSDERQMVSYLLFIPDDLVKKNNVEGDQRTDQKASAETGSAPRQNKPWWAWYAARDNPYYESTTEQRPWWVAVKANRNERSDAPWWAAALNESKPAASVSNKPAKKEPEQRKDALPVSPKSPATPSQSAPEDRWWLPATKQVTPVRPTSK